MKPDQKEQLKDILEDFIGLKSDLKQLYNECVKDEPVIAIILKNLYTKLDKPINNLTELYKVV